MLMTTVIKQARQTSQERLYLKSLIIALNLLEARVLPMPWVCRVLLNLRVLDHLVKEERIRS
jgi:hypothetical protein